ncbi:MAG: ssuD [Firmicutes bacterium]|nr:ssuD [Bacillota bacterium]
MALEFLWFIPQNGDGRKLGTQSPERLATFDYQKQLALAIEGAGFDGALMPFGFGSSASGDLWVKPTALYDNWTMAAALAAVTTKLKLLVATRPGVINAAITAKMVATLDQISGGRVNLNVISGGSTAEQLSYGDAADHDGRYRRTREYLQAIKRLWNGESVTVDGEFVQLSGATLTPLPVNAGGPRIFFGGSSELAHDIAGELADVYLSWGELPQMVGEKVADVRRRAEGQGRKVGAGVRIHVVVRDTEEEAWNAARALIADADPSLMEKRKSTLSGLESVGQQRLLGLATNDEDIVAPHFWAGLRRIRGGASTAIVGTPEQVSDVLADYVRHGIDTFILSSWPHLEEAWRVGEQVIPLVRKKAAGMVTESAAD